MSTRDRCTRHDLQVVVEDGQQERGQLREVCVAQHRRLLHEGHDRCAREALIFIHGLLVNVEEQISDDNAVFIRAVEDRSELLEIHLLGNGYPRGLDASSDLVAAAGAEGLATSSRTQLWT